jgi:hypothetical protein
MVLKQEIPGFLSQEAEDHGQEKCKIREFIEIEV